MTDLTRGEYEGLLGFAEAVSNADEAADWWEAAAELMLGSLLHADVVAVASIDHRGTAAGTFGMIRPAWADAVVPSGSEMHVDLLADHPLTLHLRGDRALETVRVSDLVPGSRWRRMAGFAKMKELIGATNQLNITVRADRSVTLSTSPIRAATDFTEHEVQVCARLRTLLQAADRHTRVLALLRESCPADELAVRRAAASHYGLTRREQVVLALLSDGLTTVASARALRVSPRTVSKHQQNLYRKLQVNDRMAAVLLARREGLTPANDHRTPTHGPPRPS